VLLRNFTLGESRIESRFNRTKTTSAENGLTLIAIAESTKLARRKVAYDVRYASEEDGDLPPLQPLAS